MDMRKLVGRNFGRLRQAKGLTQEDVSARSGFSQQYLSGLERGIRNPTVITLYELARALGVSHLDLVAVDEKTLSARRSTARKPRRAKD
jgi:transcriptional regulator with XRE-family HTH domain